MSSQWRRVLVVAGILGAAQLALWLGYRRLLERRKQAVDTAFEVPAPRRVPADATLLRPDGSTTTFGALSAAQPVLLHFWASWCVPCRDEIPTLLDLATSTDRPRGLQVVLVSVDEDWAPLRAFFDGKVPPSVLRDSGRLTSSLGVSTLPDTYLLDRGKGLLARFHGARNWRSSELMDELERLLQPR